MAPTYDPTVFNVASQRQAMDIILTPEAGMSTDERWERETPDFLRRMEPYILGRSSFRVIDWGCGLGRIARPLCHTYACDVVGVDLSPDMRRLAPVYVDHQDFAVSPPYIYEDAASSGIRKGIFDAAVAAWALQHIPKIERACAALHHVLKTGAPLFVLNRVERVIPIVGGWTADGKDVWAALRGAGFKLDTEEHLGPPIYADGSVWAVWRAA